MLGVIDPAWLRRTFGIKDTFMKKRILLSLVWAIALPMIYTIFSVLVLVILGLAGFGKTSPPGSTARAGTRFALLLGLGPGYSGPPLSLVSR